MIITKLCRQVIIKGGSKILNSWSDTPIRNDLAVALELGIRDTQALTPSCCTVLKVHGSQDLGGGGGRGLHARKTKMGAGT